MGISMFVKKKPNPVFVGMFVCIILAFLVTLGGFSFLRKQMAKIQPEETKGQTYRAHYAFIVEDSEDEYWNRVYEAAKEEGKKQDIYVEKIADNITENYTAKEYLDIALAEKIDGILLQSSSKSVGEEMDKAMEQGIPVVTMLHDNYSGRRCAFVGVNESSLGETYAKLIQENLSGSKKRILVLLEDGGEMGHNNLAIQVLRKRMPKETIQIKALPVGDDFGTEKVVRECILDDQICPDILVCLSLSSTIYANEAVVDYSKVGTVKILGAYENDEIRRALDKNIMAATIDIAPETIGQRAIKAIKEYKENGFVNEYQMVEEKVIRGKK